MREPKRLNNVVAGSVGRAVKPGDESQHPSDGLIGPRSNSIGHEIQNVLSRRRGDLTIVREHGASAGGRDAGETAKESCLTGSVGADEPENLAVPNGEARVAQRPERTEALGESVDADDSHGGVFSPD